MIYFTSQTFSLVMHFTIWLVIVFTMQEFPDRTIVLTVEQTCYGWLSGGGVWGVGGWCVVQGGEGGVLLGMRCV